MATNTCMLQFFVFLPCIMSSTVIFGAEEEFLHDNPCVEFTFGECDLDEGALLREIKDIHIDECQFYCNYLYEGQCTFFIYDKKEVLCKLIDEPQGNLLRSCEIVGGSINSSIPECFESKDPCKTFLEGNCRYDGDLIQHLDNLPSVEMCQLECTVHFSFCKYFVYDTKNEGCELLNSDRRSCNDIRGPPIPTFDECKNGFTSTSTSPSTSIKTTVSSTSVTTSTSTTEPYRKSLKILAVAGFNGELLSDVELFNPMSVNNKCVQPDSYPLKVSSLTGSNNVFCGGYVNGYSNVSNKCYKFGDKEWMEVSSLIRARTDASSTTLSNDSFWISGGLGDDSTTETEQSEILVDENGGFMMSVNLPEATYGHCSSRINETHLFIAANHYNLQSAYIVDVSSDEFGFTKLPPMQKYRYMPACGSLVETSKSLSSPGHLLIVAGGYDVVDSELFSMVRNEWIQGPRLPRAYSSGGYFTTEEHPLMVIGGKDKNGNYRNNVITYRPESNTFETMPGKMSNARGYFAATPQETDEDC